MLNAITSCETDCAVTGAFAASAWTDSGHRYGGSYTQARTDGPLPPQFNCSCQAAMRGIHPHPFA